MAKKASKKASGDKKSVETLKHSDARRSNIPTAELEAVVSADDKAPRPIRYPRNTDLDPQLVWRGKDEQDWSDLVVNAPPLYIQEKVHPKVLIDDLLKQTKEQEQHGKKQQLDLFSDFNGVPEGADRTDFYQHDQNWSNRMILGDSLQVMASLAEREGLRGRVQCIYFDPPYGIKFNSNFQWSTTSRDVKDGKADHITREPEQVKAFRDTWRDGIHSYLTYLRDRLTVARDLLTDSGSIFVQIGDENVHRVRAVMDEVFGEDNFIGLIWFRKKTMPLGATYLERMGDYIVWFGKNTEVTKFRRLYRPIDIVGDFHWNWRQVDETARRKFSKKELEANPTGDPFRLVSMWPPSFSAKDVYELPFRGKKWPPAPGQCYPSGTAKLERVAKADRLEIEGQFVRYVMKLSDDDTTKLNLTWMDTVGARDQRYVVETNEFVVQRCILMATDPGDLVLDPTCGSGTTATVAEQWGRRWITIDTSRVALALARARIMGARYPYYLLADSAEGLAKENQLRGIVYQPHQPQGVSPRLSHSNTQEPDANAYRLMQGGQQLFNNIRHGFVYERVPHITLKSIANNAEIDVIWDKWQEKLEPLRQQLNEACGTNWQEWEIPRELPATIRADSRPFAVQNKKVKTANPREWTRIEELHQQWWAARIARQREIDKSIAAKAEFEFLYDKPYEDKKKVRVAGPFTVESLSPHRVLIVDEDDELVDGVAETGSGYDESLSFADMILENLRTAGVQQTQKEDRITFTSLVPWPGEGRVCAEGRYLEGASTVPSPPGKGEKVAGRPDEGAGIERRAGIFIGPEFGTVQRADLVEAARECADAGFDVLIACAFNYEAHTTEFNKLGRIPVLKARMNADLHMAKDLKNTGKGNLFVIFGEPDIDLLPFEDQPQQIQVKINGVDIFKPQTGEVESSNADGIACWFIDTDYNEESFFVRHAYFLGANDPYKSLKTTLKAEINEDAWSTLHSDTSRPFDKPSSGRIAVKVINHLGDEVMKVFRVK